MIDVSSTLKVGYFVSVDGSVVTDPSANRPSSALSNETPPLLDIPGLRYAFCADGKVFFKSAFCEELDSGVGDLLVRNPS
jgi:hypothetical protein